MGMTILQFHSPPTGHANPLIEQHQDPSQSMRLFCLTACLKQGVFKQVLHHNQMLTGTITQFVVNTSHFQHSVDQHAAKAGLMRSWTAEVAFKEELQSVNCRHVNAGLLQDPASALTEQIKTLDKQRALVLESTVKTAATDLHSFDQIAHGGGLITFAPKKQKCFVNSLLVIEFSGTGHGVNYGTNIPQLQDLMRLIADEEISRKDRFALGAAPIRDGHE
jgi:hypothetical protein